MPPSFFSSLLLIFLSLILPLSFFFPFLPLLYIIPQSASFPFISCSRPRPCKAGSYCPPAPPMQPMQPSSNPSRLLNFLLSLSRSPAAASALAQSAPFAGAEPQESQARHWTSQLDHAPGCDKMSLCTIAPVYGLFKRLSPTDGASGGISSDSRKRQAICRPTSETSVCLTLC